MRAVTVRISDVQGSIPLMLQDSEEEADTFVSPRQDRGVILPVSRRTLDAHECPPPVGRARME